MGYGKRLSAVYPFLAFVLLVMPSAMMLFGIPVGGFEVELRDNIKGRASLETQYDYTGPFSPDIEPPTGLYIDDINGRIQNHCITCIDFILGVSKGFTPVNLTDIGILYDGPGKREWYSLENANYQIIADPDGIISQGRLDQNSTIRVALPVADVLSDWNTIGLRLSTSQGREEYFNIQVQRLSLNPPLLAGYKYGLKINDTDGTFPKPTKDDIIIENYTLIENRTMVVDHRMYVNGNGTLELRNSTLSFNATTLDNCGIIIGTSGKFFCYDSTIRAINETITTYPPWQGRIYLFEIFGKMLMSHSIITNTAQLNIFSDDVFVSDNVLNTSIICQDSAPRIHNNTIICSFPEWESRSNLILDRSNPEIVNNKFVGTSTLREGDFTIYHGTGIMIWAGSCPLIFNNTFLNLSEGIHAERFGNAIIRGNFFHNNFGGIRFEYAYGTIQNNSFDNCSISVRWFSYVTIIDNQISGRYSGIGSFHSTLVVHNNSISGYDDFGVYSTESFLDIRDNSFHPGINASKNSLGAIQQWRASFRIVDETLTSNKKSQSARMRVESLNNHESLSDEVSSYSSFGFDIKELIITNNGERIDYNPYIFTFECYGWSQSFRLNVTHKLSYSLILKPAPGSGPFYGGNLAFGIAAVYVYKVNLRPKAPKHSEPPAVVIPQLPPPKPPAYGFVPDLRQIR